MGKKDDSCLRTMCICEQKLVIIVSSILVMVMGLVSVGICAIALTNDDIQEMVKAENAMAVGGATVDVNKMLIVEIICGSIVLLAGVLGICGACREDKCSLFVFSVIALIIGGCYLAVGTVALSAEETFVPIVIRETNRICRNQDTICPGDKATNGTSVTSRLLSVGSTEMHIVERMGGCPALPKFCELPVGFEPEKACVCVGEKVALELGQSEKGGFCADWDVNGKPYCYVSSMSECGEEDLSNATASPVGKVAYTPCSGKPDPMSAFVINGVTVFTQVCYVLIGLGCLLFLSVVSSCCLCCEIHTGTKIADRSVDFLAGDDLEADYDDYNDYNDYDDYEDE